MVRRSLILLGHARDSALVLRRGMVGLLDLVLDADALFVLERHSLIVGFLEGRHLAVEAVLDKAEVGLLLLPGVWGFNGEFFHFFLLLLLLSDFLVALIDQVPELRSVLEFFEARKSVAVAVS